MLGNPPGKVKLELCMNSHILKSKRGKPTSFKNIFHWIIFLKILHPISSPCLVLKYLHSKINVDVVNKQISVNGFLDKGMSECPKHRNQTNSPVTLTGQGFPCI